MFVVHLSNLNTWEAEARGSVAQKHSWLYKIKLYVPCNNKKSVYHNFPYEIICFSSRKVYFFFPRHNRTERHFTKGVLKAMKRSVGPYSPCGTIVHNLKYLSRKIIP